MENNKSEISEEQLEIIAQKAAAKVLQKVYEEVGRSTVRLFLRALGLSCLALLAYLGATGKFK